MEERPKIKLALSATDKSLEIIGWLLIIGIWVWTLTNYSKLSATIPIHYNAAGQVDGYGKKITILLLPIIATILCVVMTILNRYPQIFKYPKPITKENALRLYANATRMIRVLKIVIGIIFGLIAFETVQNSTGQANGLGMWSLPLVLALIYIPLIYFVVKSYRKK